MVGMFGRDEEVLVVHSKENWGVVAGYIIEVRGGWVVWLKVLVINYG